MYTPAVLLLFPLLAAARPTDLQRRIFTSEIDSFDEALLFDAPAFQDPADSTQTLVGMQAFVSLSKIDLTAITNEIGKFATTVLGIAGNPEIKTDRIELFGAIGRSGKEVDVKADGCSGVAKLGESTGLPDLGMVIRNASLGVCQDARTRTGVVQLGKGDKRNFNATIFSSPPDGFGVISDIDDTVKVSHSLDKKLLFQSTLVDEPAAVTGMPDVYASLAKSLNDPQFIYVSGSPFQLYPFLRDFIGATYPKGPIFLQNLTVVDIPDLLDFARSNGIEEYKLSMIDRIHGMYPAKKFLAVGDSTQKDPETYGEAHRKFGDFITCSWIRKVDGGNNTDERFAAAFEGVPANKFRIYTDADIPGLANINVAGGEC